MDDLEFSDVEDLKKTIQRLHREIGEGNIFIDYTLHFLNNMLEYNKIELPNIPQYVRICGITLYVIAFKHCRNLKTSTEYIKVLKILEEDIKFSSEHAENLCGRASKKRLIKLFCERLDCDYRGESEFEDYVKTVPKDLLQSLQDNS